MPLDYAQALDDLAEECATITESKGFLDVELNDHGLVVAKMALIGTEVSEMIAVHRAKYDDDDLDMFTWMSPMQEDDFTEELADVIIRAFDLAGFLDLPIGDAVVTKIEKNKERPHKHGRRY